MAVEFKLPDLGENIDSGDIVNVLVAEGDEIQVGQNVLEIETGKAVVELPCPHAGKIKKIHVSKGSKVKVGDPLLSLEGKATQTEKSPPSGNGARKKPKSAATVADDEETAEATRDAEPEPKEKVKRSAEPATKEKAHSKPAAEAKAEKAPEKSTAEKSIAAKAKSTSSKPAKGKTPPAGPATRRLARELGVDLERVNGSGAGGRITEEDIKAAVRQSTAATKTRTPALARGAQLPEGTEDRDNWGPIRRHPMSKVRVTIAVNMARSASTIPHVTNFDDADITELERIRKGGMSDHVDASVKLTMMPFVMKAVAQSLRLHPMVNASIDMENEEIIYKEYVNLGVAVDTDRGLVVPVIRDVDQMSIPRIAAALQAVAEQARAAHLSLDDMRGATFTISNLGAIGGIYSTPIINLPNVAIVLVGKSRKLPVVIDDKIEVRLMMPLSLSYDHRLVDGATAARFLNEIISYLRVPGRLLLAQ